MNLIKNLKTIWKPEMYHGLKKKENFFEGWYYKIIDQPEFNIYAIIPGVSLSKSDPHAFVQVLNGKTRESNYYKYNFNDFWFSENKFEIKIGKNYFSRNKIQLDIDSNNQKISGELKFKNLYPWPITSLSPGIMGWYSFVPFMQCYHGVLSMDHNIEGSLKINNMKTDFTNGKGYTEKDWGRSFPSAWIWMQTNHFDVAGVSLTASIAHIPWLTGFFTGFITGFLYKNVLYRFTTYTGARLKKIVVSDTSIFISLEDNNFHLDITATKKGSGELASPLDTGMQGRISESMDSEILVSLYRSNKKNNSAIFNGTGRNAGLEIVGDLNNLLSGLKK